MREILEDIARRAGDFALSRQTDLPSLAIERKGRLDFVTDVDRAVERLIEAAIAERFADDGLIGEEGLKVASRSGRVWVIDPIDGTINFLRGGLGWAVSIGIFADGRPAGGAVYAPADRVLLSAESGRGAWRNGRRLAPAATSSAPMIAFSGVSTWMSSDFDRFLTGFVRDDLGLADRRSGSAATSIAAVVQGHADLYVSFGEHAWDVAGGAFIAEEVGLAHSLDWRAGIPEGHFAFVCGRPELVDRAIPALAAFARDHDAGAV